MTGNLGPWSPLSVADADARFAAFDGSWWVAGGVAIDLFVGRRTRPHGDLDVEVLARDQEGLHEVFVGWDLAVAHDGRLRQWEPGEQLVPGRGSLWCRPRRDRPWALQVLFADAADGEWVFRRDPRIRRPLPEVIHRATDGVPYVAPEIQLLFKAKAVRPIDQADFDVARPLMNLRAHEWLAAALGIVHPDHPWRAMLR